jgi:hypothetical protein
MNAYPVRFEVELAARFTRVQLLVRLAAVLVLGGLGISLGTVFWGAYLLLPVYAASRIATRGSAAEYARQDGPSVMRALHWLAAVGAWAGLVVEALPAHGPGETVRVTLEPTPTRSSPVSALLRIVTGLMSALVLGLLGFIGLFVWIWAAISILFHESVGAGAFAYLSGLSRWGVRLLAHQACLVDQYPPFSFRDGPRPANTDDSRIVAA